MGLFRRAWRVQGAGAGFNDRREIMQEWCTRMSEAIEATSRESEQADATWADVIKDDRLASL